MKKKTNYKVERTYKNLITREELIRRIVNLHCVLYEEQKG